MFDPLDTVYLSEGAFERLMGRYFDVVVSGATANDKPEIHQDWWTEFTKIAHAMTQR